MKHDYKQQLKRLTELNWDQHYDQDELDDILDQLDSVDIKDKHRVEIIKQQIDKRHNQ